jgi:protein tyrosine phosphatase (PTP) superfamily phosphohydrolase (DUF442 family)
MSQAALQSICNFLRISETLGTAGQPTPEQFAAIKDAGYQVVINLAMPDSTNALPNEGQLVMEQGLDYVHIPVVWENPTLADLEEFFETMARYQGQTIFVHCALNYRVSSFVLLYRVIRQGVPVAEARAKLLEIWEPDAVWLRFIDDALLHYGLSAQLSLKQHTMDRL